MEDFASVNLTQSIWPILGILGTQNLRTSSIYQCIFTTNFWEIFRWCSLSSKPCLRHRVRTQPPPHHSSTISTKCLQKLRFSSDISYLHGCGSLGWRSDILFRWWWKFFWMGRIHYQVSCGEKTRRCRQVNFSPFFKTTCWVISIVLLLIGSICWLFFAMVNLDSNFNACRVKQREIFKKLNLTHKLLAQWDETC